MDYSLLLDDKSKKHFLVTKIEEYNNIIRDVISSDPEEDETEADHLKKTVEYLENYCDTVSKFLTENEKKS